jgi:aminoglycoside phosphotransferase (APT) family kinase protein
LWGWDAELRHGRTGIHDTPVHLARLRRAVAEHARHPAYDAAAALAQEILARAEGLPLLRYLPERLVHGDPKITNVIFDAAGEATALVDLDTLTFMAPPLELGDAFRSWCSPAGEEAEGPFLLELFGAGLAGYADAIGPLLEREERESIAAAVETITIELAARFCTDALEESYFGWDASRFRAAWEHNLLRTRSQLALARSIHGQLGQMNELVRGAWKRPA